MKKNSRFEKAKELLLGFDEVTSAAEKEADPKISKLLFIWGGVYFAGFGGLLFAGAFTGKGSEDRLLVSAAAAVTGLAVTFIELQRIRGASGMAKRVVLRSWITWGAVVLAWIFIMGADTLLRPYRLPEDTLALGVCLSVVLVGAWLLANLSQFSQWWIGLALIVVGLFGMRIEFRPYGMIFVWLSTSMIFLLGGSTGMLLPKFKSKEKDD